MSSRQLLKVTVLTVFVLMAISSYIPDVVITFIFDGNEKMVSDEMYLGYPFHIAAIGSLLWVILIILGIIFGASIMKERISKCMEK